MRDRLTQLGYELSHWKIDNQGVKHRYQATPMKGMGGINYFDTKEELLKWIEQVEEMRKI